MTGSEDQILDVVQQIQITRSNLSLSLEEASGKLRRLGIPGHLIERAVAHIREEARRNQLLGIPGGGIEGLAYRRGSEQELRTRRWYPGPEATGGENWVTFRQRLLDKGLSSAVNSIDRASTKIVAYLGDPHYYGLQVRGLVVGHVQSGKTSNFTAVIAKAADAGYRLFIVLSGIHNALRRQTQRRLEDDLTHHVRPWSVLTRRDADFYHAPQGAGLLLGADNRILAVVKKNAFRLRHLRDWLQGIPEDIRRQCPALIIDDESDQATPNTGNEDERTRINQLIVDIRKQLPTSTYLGYTATPFANVLIDPTHPEDLYPSDFVIALPKPANYFGPESIFGREPLDDGDDPDDGYDMVRRIPDLEAAELRPPTSAEDRAGYEPPVTTTLGDAIRYFVLSCAARRARGQGDHHMSMLVHTTMYSQVHLDHRDEIATFAAELRNSLALPPRRNDMFARLATIWRLERNAVPPGQFGHPLLDYEELEPHIPQVLEAVEVLADNSQSEDRLEYGEDPRIVIAVGGNTLSRGLTLEGLTTSYFVRSGRAYDTLLQMGRWFGFRPGYEDLPRIWMSDDLRRNFRFLALVEEEIRREIDQYQLENLTPEQLAIRIRCHPTMMITAPQKMRHARKVSLSYSGDRLQTFLFEHRSLDAQRNNQEAARELISAAVQSGAEEERVGSRGRWLLRSVHVDRVIDFLHSYSFHPDHLRLRADLLVDYIRSRLRLTEELELEYWNVAVMGSSVRPHPIGDGTTIDLGEIDLGLPEPVPLIGRAKLKDSRPNRADIKALMSQPDRYIDLEGRDDDGSQPARSPNTGLLLIYPISKDSVPMGPSRAAGSRVDLDAVDHVIGVGIVFPESSAPEQAKEYDFDYVAVSLPEDDLPPEEAVTSWEQLDTEGNAGVDLDDVRSQDRQ